MTKNVVAATKQYYDNSGSWRTSEATPSADTITFTGTGFGSHALDFEFIGGPTGHLETASTGNDSNFDNWVLDQNAQIQVVDDASRGQVWYGDASASNAASMRYDYGSTFAENTKLYVSWRVKRKVNTGTGQWKMFRLSYENDIQDDGTEITMFNWNGTGSSNTLNIRPELTPTAPTGVTLYGADSNYPQTDDKWYRMEMLLDISSESVKNGSCEVWRHDDLSTPVETSWNYSGEGSPKYPTTMNYDSVRRYRWFLWQNYRGNGITDQEVWMDDAYIQKGTFKRVELCNNATYANATIREIQKITSYSDTSVIAEVNSGGFGSGTYYAHLINESGASISTQTVVIA